MGGVVKYIYWEKRSWGGGGAGAGPFMRMHYLSLVRVVEPQVQFWLMFFF